MSTAPEATEKDVRKYLDKAIARLKTLNTVSLLKTSTSHYNYGTTESVIYDRLHIQLGRDKKMQCQIVFNSQDYYFPPDLIFKHHLGTIALEVEDISVFLPGTEWDLKQEDCLYNWIDRISELLIKPDKEEPSAKEWDMFEATSRKSRKGILDGSNDEDNDRNEDAKESLSSDFEYNMSDQQPENSDPISDVDMFPIFEEKDRDRRRRKRRAPGSEDDEDFDFEFEVSSKKTRKLLDSPSRAIALASRKEDKNLQWLQKFMDALMHRYQNHIVRYDTERKESLTVYLKFGIDTESDMWKEYYEKKLDKLKEFRTEQHIEGAISKPKPFAPMIVEFRTYVARSQCKLEAKFISVSNTDGVGSSDPQHMSLKFTLKPAFNVLDSIESLQMPLKKSAIYFHLNQRKIPKEAVHTHVA